MVKRHHKSEDGMYHVKGKSFARLNGSRAEVMHETAYKTSGGLTKGHLKYNKHGHIVSKAKSRQGPMLLKRLTSKGYFTRKGTFGFVKKTPVKSKTLKRKKKKKPKSKKKGLFMREKRGPHGRFHKLG